MGNCARKDTRTQPKGVQILDTGTTHVTQSDINDKKLDFGGGNVCAITDKRSWDEKMSEASKGGKIAVVNFSSSCCGPCKAMAPTFTELSVKYPSLVFLTVDVDELSEISMSMDISSTPTFFFFKDGQPVAKVVGADEVELLKKVALFT